MIARKLSHRSLLIGIIVLSILVRVVVALFLGDAVEPISGAYDQVSYDTLATSVLAGKGFSFPTNWYPFTAPNEPTAHWSFLYTLYLVLVYSVFGHHPLIARLVQVVISSLNIVLAFRLGRRLFGEWSGLVSAGLTAGYAYLIFFNAALMTQSLYILAVLAAIDLSLILVQKPTVRAWIILGLVLGMGTLLRQTLLIFSPLLLGWIWLAGRKSTIANRQSSIAISSPSALVGILIALTVIATIVLPFTLRNYLVYKDFLLLNSNGGYWLYASNHPSQGTNFDQNLAPPLPEELRAMGEPELDRALYRAGLQFIVSDPKRFLLLSLNRTKDYFWLAPSEQSTLVSNLGRLLSFTLYLPFMLYGVWLSRRRWRALIPLYLYVGFDAVLSLISWAAPRYRLPSDAVMMTFAGFALLTLAVRLGWIPQRDADVSSIA